MIQHYLKVAVRNLLKNKVQNIITLFCLAIGIVCFSIASYYVRIVNDDSDSRLPHYKQMARLILEGSQNETLQIFNPAIIQQLESQPLPGIDKLVFEWGGYGATEVTFMDEQGRESDFQLQSKYVSDSYFVYKDFHSLYSSHSPVLNKGNVILTESCAKKVFGQRNPIGNKLMFTHYPGDKREVSYYTISDVIREPDWGANDYKIDLFFSYEDVSANYQFRSEALLAKDSSPNEINEALKNVNITDNGKLFHPQVAPFYLNKTDKGETIASLLVLLVASLVLIAGLINFLKFTIQSFYNRTRELGLRMCLGSSSTGLFMILFGEILIMLLVSLLLSMALSEWVIPHLYTYLPKEQLTKLIIEMPVLFYIQTALFLFTLLLCSGFAMGAVAHLRHIGIRQSFVGSGKHSKHTFRNAMIGLQLVIGLFFAGATFGFMQIGSDTLNSSYMPLSMDEYKERLELILSNNQLASRSEEVHEQLKRVPGVVETLSTQGNNYIEYNTKDKRTLPGIVVKADENLLSFFRIPLLRGEAPKVDDKDVVYISQAFDEILQKDTIQGFVELEGTVYRIGGVYKALPHEKFINRLSAFSVYIPTQRGSSICMRVADGQQKEVRQQVETICRRYVSETIPLEITTMYLTLSKGISVIYMVCDIALSLAIISLLISALGIYSAISLDTQSRQKEMAIRKINGATATTIALLFGRLYLILFAVAFVIAFPLSIYVVSAANNDTSVTLHVLSLGIKLFASIFLLVFGTVSYKIYRIMKQNPAEVIKTE